MKIKICGLFRSEDIDYINEALPDYAGFVFAESRRQVSPALAAGLRSRLAHSIVPVGVFVNTSVAEIAALYQDGVISIAQLHGTEDEEYIKRLKDLCDISVIKVFTTNSNREPSVRRFATNTHEQEDKKTDYLVRDGLWFNNSVNVDYVLIDSGAGSGKTFNWGLLDTHTIEKPWFLAGGINMDNIERAMVLNPYAIDISSGAERNGVKDRENILQLTAAVKNHGGKQGNMQ